MGQDFTQKLLNELGVLAGMPWHLVLAFRRLLGMLGS